MEVIAPYHGPVGVTLPNLASQIDQDASWLAALLLGVEFNDFSAKCNSLHSRFSSSNPIQIVDPSFPPCCLSGPQVSASDFQMNGGLCPQDQYFTLDFFFFFFYLTATL